MHAYRRFDGEANSGVVEWPTHLVNSGEGGTWVFAHVLAEDVPDSFVHCIGPRTTVGLPVADPSKRFTVLALPVADLIAHDPGGVYAETLDDPEKWGGHTWCFGGGSVLASVCLGTSGGTWWYGDYPSSGTMWGCERHNLTSEGLALIESLERLYSTRVHLVTYIDT